MANILIDFFLSHLTFILLVILLIGFWPRISKNFRSDEKPEEAKNLQENPLLSFGGLSLLLVLLLIVLSFFPSTNLYFVTFMSVSLSVVLIFVLVSLFGEKGTKRKLGICALVIFLIIALVMIRNLGHVMSSI